MSEEVSIVRTDEIDTRPVMYAKSDVSIVVRSSRGFVYHTQLHVVTQIA